MFNSLVGLDEMAGDAVSQAIAAEHCNTQQSATVAIEQDLVSR